MLSSESLYQTSWYSKDKQGQCTLNCASQGISQKLNALKQQVCTFNIIMEHKSNIIVGKKRKVIIMLNNL
jgi:hypothetical protein